MFGLKQTKQSKVDYIRNNISDVNDTLKAKGKKAITFRDIYKDDTGEVIREFTNIVHRHTRDAMRNPIQM